MAGVPQAEEQARSAQCDDEANVMVATKSSGGVDDGEDAATAGVEVSPLVSVSVAVFVCC